MSIDDLRVRLDKIKNGEVDENIVEDIAKETDYDTKYELVEYYLDFNRKLLLDDKVEGLELETSINLLKDKFNNSDFDQEKIEDLFVKYGLVPVVKNDVLEDVIEADIVSEEVLEDKVTLSENEELNSEVEKVETTEEKVEEVIENKDEIALLEAELADVQREADAANMSLIDYLNAEIKKLETQKSEDIKNINSQIEAIKAELEIKNLLITKEDLNKEIAKLREEQKNIVAVTSGYPNEADEARYHEINNIVKNIENEIKLRDNYADKSQEELVQEVEKLTKEQKDLVAIVGGYPSDKDVERYHEINNLVQFLNVEIKRREASKTNELDKYSDSELIEMIDKLSKEQKDIVAITGGYPSDKDVERYHEINNLVNQYKIELDRRKEYRYINLSDEEIKAQIEKLKAEQIEMVAITGGYPNDKDVERYHEINRIVSELNEELEKRKKDPIRTISSMTKEELEKKLVELEKNKKSIQSVTDKKVEELKDKLRKAERLAELKNKKIQKKEQRKDLWYKGLAAAAGVVAGLTMSSVPGVGTIRMGIAGIKLTASAINCWTNKHPEGKIAKFINAQDEKLNNFMEKHPVIAKGVDRAKETIKKLFANEKVNWFVNGVAAGYMAGNIIEMVTGETIGEHLGNIFKPNDVPSEVPGVAINTTPGIGSDSTLGLPNVTDVDITLEPGQVYDISGITEGMKASDANSLVSLATDRGKEAMVDKFVTLPNGEKMVHFKQMNGSGYAWFKASEVEEYLEKVANAASKTGRSL